jgi:DNA-binding transcriptional MerR regulator
VDEISIGEFARRARLSVKALRLYDELGVLVPARVDKDSGYRYYDVTQLDDARLVAMLRQLDVPLTTVKGLLSCEPTVAAQRIAAHWRDAEAIHSSRRDLANYLVDLLSGKRSLNMYEVATRDMPARSLLCVKRNVDEQGAWAFGKEFVAIFRERPLPRLGGREGAAFCIFWGQVSADSDGPIEWCRPISEVDAETIANQYPALTLRTEPAHQEAFVALPRGTGTGADAASWQDATNWQLASEALQTWAEEHALTPENLVLKPEDLGMRITYLASEPITETSFPDRDFAVPFSRI